MTVEGERRAIEAMRAVEAASKRAAKAATEERLAKIDYIDEALRAGWTWNRIGAGIGQTSTAVRRYYHRNRRRTHGGDI